MSRRIVITGAGSGMGASHARALSALGHVVGCLDLDRDRAQSVADECGERALALVGDVRDGDSLIEAIGSFEEWSGGLDGLVANAGVTVGGHATCEMSEADWATVIDVNLTGVWRSAKAAIPGLRRAGGGTLVLVSSVAGLSGSPGWAAYAAAKHGVIGLMRTLANELAPDRIRCNAICPGMVLTPMLEADGRSLGLSPEQVHRDFAVGHLTQRLLEPSEVSDVVAFLLSPAADVMTGVALPVDLGYLARTPGTL